MFCRKCGNEINDDALFCNKCGEKVSASAELPKAEPASAVMMDAQISSGSTAVKKGINKKILIGSIIGVVVAITAVILIMFFTRTKTVDGRFPIEDGKVHIKLPTEITLSSYKSDKGNGNPEIVHKYFFEYNDKGLMTQEWKNKGSHTYYEYDDEGNMTSKTYDDDDEREYSDNQIEDKKSNKVYYVNKQGRLLSVDNVVFKYDENNRLVKVIEGDDETTFSYNKNGKITSVSDKDDNGYVISYDDNKVSNIQFQNGGKKSGDPIEYTYKDGKLTNAKGKFESDRVHQGDLKCDDDGYVLEELYHLSKSSLKLEFKYEDYYIDLDFWNKYKTIYAYEYLSNHEPLNDMVNERTLEYYVNYNCLDELIFVGGSEVLGGELDVTPEELYQMGYNCNDNTFGKARPPKGSNIRTVDDYDDYLQSDEHKFEIANNIASMCYYMTQSSIVDMEVNGYDVEDLSGTYTVENGKISGENSSFVDHVNEPGNIDDGYEIVVQFTEDDKIIGQYPEPPSSVEESKEIVFGE